MKKNKLYRIQNLAFVILFTFFQSCQYFEKKVPSEKELLEKQLKEINWDQVDEYPSVNSCDTIPDKEARKVCFFEFVSKNISEKLMQDKVYLMYPKIDTLNLKVTVSANSDLYFETQKITDTLIDKTKIDSVINSKLLDFPRITPAIKRGIPVKTQFELPIILKEK
jgi:hypothetical protein